MDWDAIGAIGEIIGALAVVATLAYLARQVRTQNTATEAIMYDSVTESFSTGVAMIAENAEVARIWRVGLLEPDSLTDDEAAQFSAIFRLFVNNYYKLYRLVERGVLPESEWKQLAAQAADIYELPGGKLFAKGHPTFQSVTDAMVREKVEGGSIDWFLGRS